MTKTKKPPVMIECARCKQSITKASSCSWRCGNKYSRLCQDCTRRMFGMAPRAEQKP